MKDGGKFPRTALRFYFITQPQTTPMKKTILSSLAMLFMAYGALAQNCNLLLKDGGKATLNIVTYTNPLNTDKKFLNAKEEKKDEQVAAFNAGVAAGTTAPTANYNMVFDFKKTKLKDADEYAIGYTVSGKTYYSYLVCHDDTIFQWRNRGPILIGPEDNPYAIALQGAQALPMKMKVGDVLPLFDDISVAFPTQRDYKVDINVFDGWGSKSSTYWGYGTDSRTGESGVGSWDVTTPVALYKKLRVDIREKASVSGHSIHYMNAVVTGEEEMTVSGIKYKAFVIESEVWTKQKVDVTYESAYQQAIDQQEMLGKMVDKFTNRLMVRKQFTNKQGYMVMYSKEWFVPSIGVVKTVSYDIHGGIFNVMTTTKIE